MTKTEQLQALFAKWQEAHKTESEEHWAITKRATKYISKEHGWDH